MQLEIPLSQYHKMTYPMGRPSIQTLRNDILAGRLPGRYEKVNKINRYFVFVGPTTGDDECDAILTELGNA